MKLTGSVAIVTGGSRGIGFAIARALGMEGARVAIASRGAGELEQARANLELGGIEAFAQSADVASHDDLRSFIDEVLRRWGRVDVLVNNGRYVGPGHMDSFLDTPIDLHEKHLEANVLAPIVLTKLVLPQMLERGEGYIVNVASGAGASDPPAAAGKPGGWGLGYGMSKGALHRLAGILTVELGDRGIVAYNLSPGFVATERIAIDMGTFGFDASKGAPPDVVGAVVAWLVTTPEGRALNGSWVEAQDKCRELGLVPDWDAQAG
jgi:NAD(P)-dependent dehydrogenase (short-subunit alcohol dehydrogenase family)